MAQLEDPEKILLENFAKREERRAPIAPHDPTNKGNQIPQAKKPGTVIDCNEAAKLFGGVVFVDFGRKKRPLWA